MLLNAALVEKLAVILKDSLSNIEKGNYLIFHDLGDEFKIEFIRDHLHSNWIINGLYFGGDSVSNKESKNDIHKDIAILLIKLAIVKAEEEDKVRDMFGGLTTNVIYESAIGLTVKFHWDVDSRCLMIAQTANPGNLLYALEEAVNQEMLVNPQLMTPTYDLQLRTLNIFADYLLADLITHDVAI